MPWKTEKNEPDLIQEEIKNLGVRCEKIALELSKETSIQVLFNTVENKLGSPTILVNNATYSTQTNILNIIRDTVYMYGCMYVQYNTTTP